ncbi:MAG: hypothetical protein QNJ29_11275, partial [Rhizobiaceae bacterium]|nr:hypothetical protein [Rhizobiaceae bacterium]
MAVAPLALFWFLPNSSVLNDELEDVRERHLLIAKNLSEELANYHEDLEQIFSFVRANYSNIGEISALDSLFQGLDVRHFCVVDASTGSVLKSIHAAGPLCPERVPAQRFQIILDLVDEDPSKIVTTGVFPASDTENVFYLLNKAD